MINPTNHEKLDTKPLIRRAMANARMNDAEFIKQYTTYKGCTYVYAKAILSNGVQTLSSLAGVANFFGMSTLELINLSSQKGE